MSNKKLTPWERFIGLLQLERKDILQIFYYAIFAGVVSLSLPLGIQAIINLIQGARMSTSWIILVILVTIGVAFVGILQLMQIRILEDLQQKLFMRSSFEFAYRFPKIKMQELRDYYPPELANRFFDTLTAQKGLSKLLLDLPTALVQIIFGLLLLSLYHPFFIVYGLLLLLLLYALFKYTAKKGLDTSLTESKYKYKVAHWIQEVARTIVSFKLSGRTNLSLRKTDALVVDYIDSREGHFKILKLQFILLIGFKVLVTAGLLVIGGALVFEQEMNIGQFVAAEIVILLIIGSVEKIITGLESFYDMITALEKIGQVVDKELESQSGETPLSAEEDLKVELRNLSYKNFSGDKFIIHDISMTITPGEHTLLSGPNGSGKSTLLKIIAGVLEPDSGQIYVNNHPLSNINLNHYRGLLGQSLNDETPFEGTLLDNITFGDASVPSKDVQWAIDNIGLSDYVKQLPKGLNTMIYPEGKQVSYTVAKKIILARSIVRKPHILILKDPLNQMETTEETKILDFLFDKTQPWTIIVATKDPAWRKYCQRQLILDQGTLTQKL
ncbi:MAG: ATP-binding cassette domain-containing protein [Leeuwenhoekiella sp.]